MIRLAFITVTDTSFFPGTLAAVNSVLEFHPDADVFVINSHEAPLTPPQLACLQGTARLRVVDAGAFDGPGRRLGPFELKAYAAHDLCDGYDVIAGIDADCVLCSDVSDVVQRCHERGGFAGGRDGDGTYYGESYRPYGFAVPVHNPCYMSTSLYFVAVTPRNREVLARWVACTNQARYNGLGEYSGHVDQGVLNAVLFALERTADVELLDNRLWSQHRDYWESIIHCRDGRFLNVSAFGLPQRAFHSGGALKPWLAAHRDRIFERHELQMPPYLWFLTMLWFGRCGDWSEDPHRYLPEPSRHLFSDLIDLLPQIMQVYPPARDRWNALSPKMMERAFSALSAPSWLADRLPEVMALVADHPGIRRYVEIGGYEGGTLIRLGLRFLNRDIDFYSVESFTGNLSGSVDGFPLPSRKRFLKHLRACPGLRVRLIPGDSVLAAALFDDASLDCVFIDACHSTPAVMADVSAWLPKVRPGGLLCGDDYYWPSVKQAVDARFTDVRTTPSGRIWWTVIDGHHARAGTGVGSRAGAGVGSRADDAGRAGS